MDERSKPVFRVRGPGNVRRGPLRFLLAAWLALAPVAAREVGAGERDLPRCPDSAACFLEGISAFRDARYEEAVAALETSLQEPSGWEEYAYFYLILSRAREGGVAETLGLCKQFQERFPRSPLRPRVDRMEADGYRKSSAWSAALGAYERLIERQDSADLRLSYGEVLEAMDRWNEAYRNYRTIREKWPRSSAARQAKSRAEKVEQKIPGWQERRKGVQGLREEERMAMREWNWPEALSLQEKMLSLPLSSSLRRRVLNDRVQALVNSGRLEAANDELRTLLDRYPLSEEAAQGLFAVGRGYWRKDRNREAFPLLERLVDDYTDFEEAETASFILGRIHVEEGNLNEAVRWFRYTRFLFPWTEREREAAWWEAWSLYRAGDYRASADLLGALETGQVWVPELVPRSRYWQSRSLEKAGDRKRSRDLYRGILESFPAGYYGVLARSRLGDAATFSVSPSAGGWCDFGPEERALRLYGISLMLQDPALPLLLQAGLRQDALDRLDWLRRRPGKTRSLAAEDWITAYFLADSLPRAIRAAYESGLLDRVLEKGISGTDPDSTRVLCGLYPLFYWDLIRQESEKRRLDPFLVAGLIRQESLFQPHVLSPAGAVGLMQIMPATGSRMARKMGIRNFKVASLRQPAVNLRIGTAYLAELLDRYGPDWHKILANYNAGPLPVAKWTAAMPDAEPDEFVENILYNETRLYVKKVLFNRDVYRTIYGKRGP